MPDKEKTILDVLTNPNFNLEKIEDKTLVELYDKLGKAREENDIPNLKEKIRKLQTELGDHFKKTGTVIDVNKILGILLLPTTHSYKEEAVMSLLEIALEIEKNGEWVTVFDDNAENQI